MKIKRLIKQLQKFAEEMPEAEVRLNDKSGSEALFAVAIENTDAHPELKNVVWIESKDDIDMGEELEARFANAAEEQLDELDFFMDLLDTGFTLDDIKTYVPDRYEYAKTFMEEHGLI